MPRAGTGLPRPRRLFQTNGGAALRASHFKTYMGGAHKLEAIVPLASPHPARTYRRTAVQRGVIERGVGIEPAGSTVRAGSLSFGLPKVETGRVRFVMAQGSA